MVFMIQYSLISLHITHLTLNKAMRYILLLYPFYRCGNMEIN